MSSLRSFLDGVEDLELYGFSIQNVISGLTIENTESGFRLKLWPCYGLAGWLTAKRVSIEFSSSRFQSRRSSVPYTP
jgi:hypothetical protein